MGQAKRRQQLLQTILSGSHPEEGLYFVYKRHGVSVALIAKKGQRQQINAGLYCIDERKEGLFRCIGRTYESEQDLQEELRKNINLFRPISMKECGLLVERGRAIRRRAGAPITSDFDEWLSLLPSMDNPEYTGPLYYCPICEGPLPEATEKTILSTFGDDVDCYLLCPPCSSTPSRGPTPETVSIKHRQTMLMFKEMDRFTLNFNKESSALHLAEPGQTHREAILIGLEQDGDPVKTAAFAMESWIHRATVPNDVVTDDHVLRALGEIRHARQNNVPLPEDSPEVVKFVRDAAEDGMAMFSCVCADRLNAWEREQALTQAIEKIMDSARLHKAISNPRSYIDFVAPNMK